jgi:hypothetical protein
MHTVECSRTCTRPLLQIVALAGHAICIHLHHTHCILRAPLSDHSS